jgi:hypothetical protein
VKLVIALVCVGVTLHIQPASGQNVRSLRPSMRLQVRGDTVHVLTKSDSVERESGRKWPTYMLGGAVIGGALVAGYALTHCDQTCKDDGSLAFAPPFVLAGAAVGGLVGLGVGLAVEASHRSEFRLRISIPAP